MIEVTLVLNGKELDVFVPEKIMFGRLKSLIFEALKESGVRLPKDSYLSIKDKTFEMGEYDFVSDFGVANGDKIEILAGKTDEDI